MKNVGKVGRGLSQCIKDVDNQAENLVKAGKTVGRLENRGTGDLLGLVLDNRGTGDLLGLVLGTRVIFGKVQQVYQQEQQEYLVSVLANRGTSDLLVVELSESGM